MLVATIGLMLTTFPSLGQAIVFNDDFAASTGSGYTTTPGPIGSSSVWTMSRSGADWGASIQNGMLMLTDDASGAANQDGWVLASASTSAFPSPFSSTLASNPGLVTWTFNMRQSRNNPSGFGANEFGSAFILAGTAGTTNLAGTGYAVVLGNSGKVDALRLVRYNSGIRNHTNLISSSSAGLTDFGKQFLSVKVTYQPATQTWQLFVRNDNSAFTDPALGSYALQGSSVNSTYTGSALPILGGYWNGGSFNSQVAFFDNVRVTVALPQIISLAPSSKIAGTGAFTLTVNGLNFSASSIVNWNGSPRTTTYISPTQVSAAITAADIIASGTANITVSNGAAISNTAVFTIDAAGLPALAVSNSALSNMVTTSGIASASQSYVLTGANMSGNATVTAPANFEVSANNSTWSSSLSYTPVQLSGAGQTVYVRVAASAPGGIYSATVNNSTSGATDKPVSVSATVYATEPTLQASAVTFTNVTSTTFTANFNSGNGSGRILLIRSGSAVNAGPVDGSSYVASSVFAGGTEVGTANFIAYMGSGNSVTISGLTPATTYHVAVYEYNGTAGTQNFLLTSPATGNRLTLNAPLGWQIYAVNAVNTINFDSTVDGVTTDEFQGDGVSPGASTGELNSNAWAFTGFSDGAIGFGGLSNDGTDYDRGESEGGVVTTGGLYAFNTSSTAVANYSLGVQQAASDFVPGTVTLRFQNQSAATITSVNIGYKVYVYNDQAGSSSFNFSHSANTTTFTTVPGLDVVTEAAADPVPSWKAYYRVVNIAIPGGLAPNNYYYLRWTGAAVSGTVFDEIALDDIVMVANPTSNFAPFAGNAETFVVQGNASLSGDLSVASNITFNTGGRLDIGARTLGIAGTITNNVTGGIRGGASSNLTINGAVSPSVSLDMTTPGTTNLFNNFTVSTTASNTVTMLNPVAVNGALSTSAGQTLNLGTNALTGTLASIANNGTIATQNTTSTPLPSGKTWGGTGTVVYNSAALAQTIVTGTYHNLTASSTAGSSAAGSFTVNGTLNLPSANPSATVGSLSMGTFVVTMGPNATNTGIGDVTGITTRNSITNNVLYTFGSPHTSIIFPVAGTLPTSMSLKVQIGTAPSWRPGAIQRQYDFIQSGASGTKAVIKAHYKDSELNGNNENKLVDWARIVASSTTLEQGRSNYNTTENWVELANVNVGLYFQSTFDAVLLTLDESEVNSLTWNGSVSDSWTTTANWTPNATPSDNTIVYIPNAATTPNDPLLNPTSPIGGITIEAGGILNGGSGSIQINGVPAPPTAINGYWINNGTFNPGTSTVIFNHADATVAGTTNFYNVTVNSGMSLRPVTGNVMRIAGTLTNNGTLLTGVIDNTVEFTGTNQTIPAPNGTIAAYHNLVISGTGAVLPSSLNIRGNLTTNQTVSFAGKTITMAGQEHQVIGGTVAPAFNNLTINNTSGGVQLASAASVTGTLTLTSGLLDIAGHNLTLGANAVAGSFSSTNMIVASGAGELRRTFTSTGSYLYPIGDNTGTIEYSPVTVFVNSGSFSNAYVGVQVRDAIHPNNSSATQNLTRYWNVTQSGITGAVATITATYLPADITGTESQIAAAQLNGTFNQQTNPWIRFGVLGSNTLSAPAVTLTAGQASAFTGIKGAAFTADITGYGEFCQNQPATLLANTIGGDGPFTYLWSNGLGTGETATPSTATVGTVTYTVTVKDNNGITATGTAAVVVLAPSAGGTTSPNQNICSGATPGDITLSGHVGQIVHWQHASDLNFTNPVIIANTTTVLSGAQIGPLTASAYFRAVVKNGSCSEVYSAAVGIIVKSTTWNGTTWSDGAPDASTAVIFAGNYTASADLQACTITVQNNAVVNIPSGLNVTTYGAVTVTSGTFTLENNANLLQLTDVANSGNITVKRNSSALKRLDYTLWSSPVDGQNLLAFSPLTTLSPSRFYTYSTAQDIYVGIAAPGSVDFNTAQGYLIRMPNNHPSVTPTIWTGVFTGVPHNGNITYTLSNAGQMFNAVGNPYPSPIDAVSFVNANSANITGTLYFWRKTNNQLSPSYCSWTAIGGFVSNGEAQVFDPQDVIRTGQGFFVQGTGNGTDLNFTNAMRIPDTANQFFRNDIEKNRIWLNVSNAEGAFSQTLVGYFTGATLGVDQHIDGKYINDGPLALTTMIDNVDHAIQGRPLPFADADVVPLKLKATTAGTYVISLDHVDGLFEGGQDIFIKDNLTGMVHDIKVSDYSFTTEAGTFTSRFELVFNDVQLGNPQHGIDTASIIVASENGKIKVNAGNLVLDSVEVYDLRGRLVASRSNIHAGQVVIETVQANQVLVAKITTADGSVTTRKVMN